MTLVEIEESSVILPVMVYSTPIWYFPVYEVGECEFSWMGEGKLGREIVKVGSIIINDTNYANAAGITDPMTLQPQQFCQIKNKVFVRAENDNPIWVYYNPRYNTILGFTDEKSREIDGMVYKAGLDYTPTINDEADNLEYGVMKFATENIHLINTKGEYDAVTRYFGNNIRIKREANGNIKGLYEYYIKNVKIKEDKITFVCGDRRERLQQKVPNQRFTVAEYPYMKPELEGQIKQDVYGECEWIKCVCNEELKIYDGYEAEKDAEGNLVPKKKEFRTFYAARKITLLWVDIIQRDGSGEIKRDEYGKPKTERLFDYVWVKQTQPEDGGEVWTPRPVIKIYKDKGEFTLDITHCMPPWEGEDVPEVYEIRACGVFWAPDTKREARPLDIIKELLRYYCGIPCEPPSDQYWYKLAEIRAEIGDLAPIGIVYDSEIGVFEAIEKLQNASDYGFRFMADYNLFTARRDESVWDKNDPNRRLPAGTIKITDIVDIGKAELDMQVEHYATIVDIAYKRNYYQDTASHHEGKNNREALLNVHGVEKIYEPETYLTNYVDAKKKADRLEAFFCRNRIMIKNLEVLNFPALRVFDIVHVDLRIPLERKKELKQIAVLFEGPARENMIFGDWPEQKIYVDFGEAEKEEKYRDFGGIITCKVMSVSQNTDTMVNTLSLLEVEKK